MLHTHNCKRRIPAFPIAVPFVFPIAVPFASAVPFPFAFAFANLWGGA